MNNQQFRKLVLENTNSKSNDDGKTPAKPSATPFGAKARGFMTPRHTKGNTSTDFRNQLLEQAADKQQRKKFRSSAAPKGTKLASGYRDRTQDRKDEEDDDKAKRIKALEESMKLGQIDQETFEKIRDTITGGDISATHLVKGLDRKLLERIKRGEDVLSEQAKEKEEDSEEDVDEDVDEALEQLGDEEIAPVVREKVAKKGDMAPPPPIAGVKRDRNAILAELRASRLAAAEAKAASASKFRKIGEKRESSRMAVDAKGRDVLIITDADGNEKRKIRKTKAETPGEADKDAEVLGADVVIPEQPPSLPVVEDDDEDMFADAGTDYNPLGLVPEDDDSSSDEDKDEDQDQGKDDETRPSESLAKSEPHKDESSPSESPPPVSQSQQQSARRNYFNDEPEAAASEQSFNPLQDPTILAALRKSRDAALKPTIDPEEEARQKKREAMLASSNRDWEDMDLGFGSSKFADEDEMEDGEKIKLSEWGDDGDGKDGEKGGKKRKRGPKKKKGDKNNAGDVMKVLEGRKGAPK